MCPLTHIDNTIQLQLYHPMARYTTRSASKNEWQKRFKKEIYTIIFTIFAVLIYAGLEGCALSRSPKGDVLLIAVQGSDTVCPLTHTDDTIQLQLQHTMARHATRVALQNEQQKCF